MHASPRPGYGHTVRSALLPLFAFTSMACTGEFQKLQVNTEEDSPRDRYVREDGEPVDATHGEDGSVPGMPIEPTTPGMEDPCQAVTEQDPGLSPMRLLSRQEFDHIMGDLFPGVALPDANLPEDERVRTIPHNVEGKISSTHVDRYRDMAEAYATALAEQEDLWLRCGGTGDREACVRDFLEGFLPRHYRRPITEQDLSRALSLYHDGVEEQGSHQSGTKLLMEGLLQAPSFMYSDDTPRRQGGESIVALDDHQLAYRMATLLWRSIPDATLLDAAARGDLRDPVMRQDHARRMLDDPRADAAIGQLLLSIFDIDTLEPQSVGLGDEALRLHASMMRESNALIAHTLSQKSADYRFLLTSPYTFVDERLAAHYGVAASELVDEVESGLYKVSIEHRKGILTHASVLAHYDDVIHRGKRIRNNLLCDDVPGPGANIDTEAIPTLPDESDRSKANNRMKTPACSTCHLKMDNMGVIFETFDWQGVLRSEDEHGNPVSSAGDLQFTLDIDGEVRDARELADRLAGSKDVQNCMAENIFSYGFARHAESAQDACTVHRIESALETNRGDVREALLSIIDSPTFTLTRTLH